MTYLIDSVVRQTTILIAALATASGKSLHQLSAAELDQLWEAAKQAGGDTP